MQIKTIVSDTGSKLRPLRRKFRPGRMRRIVRDIYWGIRHRLDPRNRYHVMDTGLRPGYWDPDSRILNAVMEEVDWFFRRTRETVDWTTDPGHYDAFLAMEKASAWWMDNKAKMRSGDMDFSDEMRLNNEADALLAEVIMGARQYMWYP